MEVEQIAVGKDGTGQALEVDMDMDMDMEVAAWWME